MPTYNSVIDRTGAQSLMPEQYSREIVQGAIENSAVLRLARRLPNMQRSQTRMTVLSALPTAYFVSGDNGLKQTTEVSWADKYIYAEEIAVIVPIPESVLADSEYDIWGEVRPRLVEAIGKVIDAAVLFGTNAPTAWPDDLLTAATAASHTVDHSSFSGDYFDEIMGASGVLSLVEADGFMVNGHVAGMSMKAALRGLRDGSTGAPIFMTSMQGSTQYALDGAPMFFPANGSFNESSALMFSGDWSQLVYSVRQDVTTKILTEAVIQDGSGNIVYNLAQQDMVALRMVMRLGWQLPNPINRLQPTEASRLPFAVLVP
jgi:HK97 family phage major capsid protein